MPTFHGSAADVFALAASFTSMLGFSSISPQPEPISLHYRTRGTPARVISSCR